MAMISVIVPVYKVEEYIHRCVDSILAQTFADFELILVDDGSPDGCPAICDEYSLKDPRVHVIHQQNGGSSEARNTGINWVMQNSASQWIAFIDSDDWVDPTYLESLYSAVMETGTKLSACCLQKTDGMEWTDPGKIDFRTVSPEDFWCEDQAKATFAWGKLYWKEDFDSIRFPAGKLLDDVFITYHLLFSHPEVAVTDAQLYFYYQNPEGIMRSEWTPGKLDRFEAYEQQIKFFSENGFLKAMRQTEFCSLDACCDQMRLLRDKPQYAAYSKSLKKYLRRKMREYGHDLSISLPTHERLYKYAYPCFERIYRRVAKKHR